MDEKEKAMYLYAMYIVLYTNDLALFSIKNLRSDIKEKDSETKKIFGALNKRVWNYDNEVRRLMPENDKLFIADYGTKMDEYFDKDVEGLRRSAEWIFRCNGYTDCYFCSKIELSFAMTRLSVSIANAYIDGLKRNYVDMHILEKYRLDEVMRIMDNLYDWVMLLQHKKKVLNLSKYKSISKYYERIKMNTVNKEIFREAYSYAVEEEKKRKTEVK